MYTLYLVRDEHDAEIPADAIVYRTADALANIDPRYLCISCEQSKYIPQTKAQMLEKIKKNFERYASMSTRATPKSPFGLKTQEEVLYYLQSNG